MGLLDEKEIKRIMLIKHQTNILINMMIYNLYFTQNSFSNEENSDKLHHKKSN